MIKGIIRALKIYVIADTIFWAVIGASHVVDKFRRDPDLGVIECADEILDETYHRLTGE